MDVKKVLQEPEKKNGGRLVRIFMITIAVISFVGLLFFFRPSVSETEKRNLAKFPDFTWDSFLSGEYFDGISTWYADTFPGREVLIRVSQGIQNLFGIQDEIIIRNDPEPGNDDPEETQGRTQGGTFDDTTPGEKLGGVYVKGSTAYELYVENVSNSERYAGLISKAAEKLSGKATVYDLIVPLSSNVNLSSAEQKKIGNSDAQTAIDRMFSGMQNVRTIDVLDTLISHNNEYLYFRTDHHWTATGAYYAYTQFCKSAGLSAHSLDDFEKYEFGNFLGTLYNEAGSPQKLSNTPDTVVAYKPNGTNTAYITDRSGQRLKYSNGIVRTDTDTFYKAAGSKYNCFIMGDNPLTEIHNEKMTDGSSICVVKESFGNAFVPFLVDHYEYVYVIDYRYFTNTTGKTLDAFVSEKGIETVLFINNLTATSASPRLNELSVLIGE